MVAGQDRQERRALTQVMFRAANEAILGPSRASDSLTFICECGSETCLDGIRLTLEEYESVRADGRSFVLASGHEGEGDSVVAELESFTLVEKVGPGARVASAHNPRGRVGD